MALSKKAILAAKDTKLKGPVAVPEWGGVSAEVLLWCGGDTKHRSDEDAVRRIAEWRQRLPAATLRPLVTTRPPGMLVAEDTPGPLASALLAFCA